MTREGRTLDVLDHLSIAGNRWHICDGGRAGVVRHWNLPAPCGTVAGTGIHRCGERASRWRCVLQELPGRYSCARVLTCCGALQSTMHTVSEADRECWAQYECWKGRWGGGGGVCREHQALCSVKDVEVLIVVITSPGEQQGESRSRCTAVRPVVVARKQNIKTTLRSGPNGPCLPFS